MPDPICAAMTARLALLITLGALGACGSSLDCSGHGEVQGSYAEINVGSVSFDHGLAWVEDHGGYTVLFSDDALLIDALRASSRPQDELHAVASLLGRLVAGYHFHEDGSFREHFTEGTGVSSGWSSADQGHVALGKDACLRGTVRPDSGAPARFALPMRRAGTGTLELERADRPAAAPALPSEHDQEDPLQLWQAAYRRLTDRHPVTAVQALGFSTAVAEKLVGDPRVAAALDRVVRQCPDPASARLGDYGDVVGMAHPMPGIVLGATAEARQGDGGAALGNCYVMERNGQPMAQCWPMQADCTTAALWQPGQ